jgi:hypothetical protein
LFKIFTVEAEGHFGLRNNLISWNSRTEDIILPFRGCLRLGEFINVLRRSNNIERHELDSIDVLLSWSDLELLLWDQRSCLFLLESFRCCLRGFADAGWLFVGNEGVFVDWIWLNLWSRGWSSVELGIVHFEIFHSEHGVAEADPGGLRFSFFFH